MNDTVVYLTWFAVVLALAFDVINGFHDAANSIATIVSTRVLSPKKAVLWAAGFNFAAMFIFEPKVAETISRLVRIEPGEPAFVFVVLAALLGAVAWNIITWVWALPTSSSHALVGALAGAGLCYGGPSALGLDKIFATIGFIPLAPLIGFTLGAALMLAASWLLRPFRPYAVDAVFRRLQLLSAAAYSLGHGGNDAQKTVGIIVALLIAAGELPHQDAHEPVPWSIIFACNAAMAIGTSFGGWRIVKTMGMKITRLKPVGGVCAELAGAATLFGSTLWGIPVSTTHTITGSIVGVGATRRLRSIRWGMATRIIYAWLLTMPAAAILAALAYGLLKLIFKTS